MNWDAIIAIGDILSLLSSVILCIGLWYVNAKTARIDTLEARVTDAASEAIDTRFDLLASEFKGIVENLSTVVRSAQDRLERGDQKFDTLDEGRHKIELQSTAQLAGVRTWAIETFATRAEMGALTEQVQQLRIRVGAFEASVHHRGQK